MFAYFGFVMFIEIIFTERTDMIQIIFVMIVSVTLLMSKPIIDMVVMNDGVITEIF